MQVPNNYSTGCSLHSDVATQDIFSWRSQLDRDKLEQNLCIVSTIRFVLGNLIYERGIKFRDLLRNNNKLIRQFGSQDFFFTNCEIFDFLNYKILLRFLRLMGPPSTLYI